MPRILVTGFALVILLTAAFSTTTQQFSLKLEGPNIAVKSDSEIHVKATITNISSREIRFAVGFSNNEFDYDIEVAQMAGWSH